MPDSAVEQGWWNRPHESQLEGQLRAQRVYQKIVARHGGSDDRVGLISHADFYQLFLSVVLGVSAGNTLFFELNNAAITRIDLEENQINVVYLNRLDYMPHELITR
jgi:2,3-bisphosphoglycerate-dependent phosphoglycerate mutase